MDRDSGVVGSREGSIANIISVAILSSSLTSLVADRNKISSFLAGYKRCVVSCRVGGRIKIGRTRCR